MSKNNCRGSRAGADAQSRGESGARSEQSPERARNDVLGGPGTCPRGVTGRVGKFGAQSVLALDTGRLSRADPRTDTGHGDRRASRAEGAGPNLAGQDRDGSPCQRADREHPCLDDCKRGTGPATTPRADEAILKRSCPGPARPQVPSQPLVQTRKSIGVRRWPFVIVGDMRVDNRRAGPERRLRALDLFVECYGHWRFVGLGRSRSCYRRTDDAWLRCQRTPFHCRPVT